MPNNCVNLVPVTLPRCSRAHSSLYTPLLKFISSNLFSRPFKAPVLLFQGKFETCSKFKYIPLLNVYNSPQSSYSSLKAILLRPLFLLYGRQEIQFCIPVQNLNNHGEIGVQQHYTYGQSMVITPTLPPLL